MTLLEKSVCLFARINSSMLALSWRKQVALFTFLFWVATVLCSIPKGFDFNSFTLNQALEDFGVFLLFLAVWCGVYCHFHRTISLMWLLLLLSISLWQEEVNLLNKSYQVMNQWFGIEIGSQERQRGDVYALTAVALTLLGRLIFERGFKSFFRIHITAFLIIYTSFQIWVHYVFPYQMQQEILNQRMNYQKELTSTYEGRFFFQCDNLEIECYQWLGDEVPETVSSNPKLMDVVRSHAGVRMNTDGFIDHVPLDESTVFRGVDAQQKYIVTFFKNGDLQRVVYDRQYPAQVMTTITRPLLIFTTTFGMVWFFLGLAIVFMHQERVYRIKYGSAFIKSQGSRANV